MNRIIAIILLLLFLLPVTVLSQQITYSEYENDDSRDMNFEIIGKMNGNFLVYKNIRSQYKLCIYDNDMKIKESSDIDFFSEKTLHVDFITYPGFFYMIYQFQKKNIVHCMGVKMDGNGKRSGEPVELDTTRIPYFDDNKIYSTINSEDKKKIMVFKIQKKNETLNMVTLLFDDQLKLINKTRQAVSFEEHRDNYREFQLDNDGNFIFTFDKSPVNRDYSNTLNLVTKAPFQDTFSFHLVNLEKKYIDDVKLKIDNLNKRYFINSLYYKKNRGSVEGLFTWCWDKRNERQERSDFTEFDDSLRAEARKDGALRSAFDDFFIRQVIVKKDGGFLMAAEDFSSDGKSNNNNNFNRWDYLNNPYSLSPNSYYYYNPYYGGYYRPYSSFSNQNIRYFYENIFVLSVDKNGKWEWNKIIHKDQFDDDNENFLSYATVNSGDEIHFLFNADNKNQIISDQSITPAGAVKRNPTLRSQEKGYQFMTKLSKQTGARQLLVPCIYRGYICFAKVDF
jgi:hypothetical protein